MEEPALQPIVTLFDAITDSPVFRSSVYRYDEQLETLEQWLDSFSRQLKVYTEKLNKLNMETVTLCQNALPRGIDEALLDPNFTGPVMKSFTDALQSSLSFKSKLVSNLEERLISPIQQFVKTHLREFKSFRKQHEKALERYETQLMKYSTLSKTKEPSSIREEAFRLHEARKEYVKMSGQHVLRILNFRSSLEHCLVEKFADATLSQRDFYSDVQIWANLDAALTYWKQWLVDEKYTCTYQLHKQQIARKKLEEEYIRLTAPNQNLGKYIPTNNSGKSDSVLATSKWGYLFVRVSRLSWARKWFFIHSGYFGSCQVDTTAKRRGSISIESRVSILDCELVTLVDIDRRFCFEISVPKSQNSYVLQAETEESMQEWVRIFSKNKSECSFGITRSPSLRIKPKSNPTTGLSSPTTTTTTEIVTASNTSSSPKIIRSDSSSSFSNISSISDTNNITPTFSDAALTLSRNFSDEGPSIVMVSTTPDTEASLDNSPSLTPLLVWEAARTSLSSSTKKLPSISWGIPWSLVPTMVNLTQDTNQVHEKSTTPPVLPRIIWPANPAWVDIPKIKIPGYTDKMNSQNRELRRLFGGVKTEEVVLDVFVGCLRKKPAGLAPNLKEIELSKSSLNTPDAELYENELVDQLKKTGLTPPTQHGYAYSGRGFITQETFWFYSCVLMTCINTAAIRLKDIDHIKVIKDTSLKPSFADATLPMNSELVISIHLISSAVNDIQEPIIIGTIMDDIDMVAEKLRFAVANAKNNESMQLRNIYSKMTSLSSTLSAHKSVVLDIPLTFNSAIQPVLNSNQENVYPKRPHANTIGSQDKVNTTGILKTNRQRGDSEPIKSTIIVEQKKKAVVEPPFDPDMPPSHIHSPQGSVECNCDDHLERKDAQITLPISAKRCYELLFSNEQTGPPTNGGVWEQKTAAIVGHDLSVTKWEMLDGKMQRILKYWMPVSNPIVRMKEAEVVENQVLIHKEDYIRYVIQISTKTAALPYADAFIPCVRYCITWVSKSECELTCYLGVKWVKSVFVRAIVTRAALKGMSDSVGVFIPILKLAADNIKDSLDKSKHEVSHQRNSLDETLSQKSYIGMESLVEEEQDDKSVDFVQEEDEIMNEIELVPAHKILPLPTISSFRNPEAPLHIPQQNPSVPTAQTAEIPRTLAQASSTTLRSRKAKLTIPAAPENTWLSTIMDFFISNITSIAQAILFVFTVYMTIIYFKSGRALDEANNYFHLNITDRPALEHLPDTRLNKSLSRSVYLRDLDEGFLKNSILPPYSESESYELFLESKQLESNKMEKESGISNRSWYSVDHYRLAVDLDISRERIAMLRHDMLIIFQVLNKVDSQLVENEYMNWLLDTRLKCKYNTPLAPQDPRVEKSISLCNDIRKQLDRLF